MIIHLTGADTYRSAQRLAELRSAFVAKHDPQGFNTVTLDGSTVTAEELHRALTATGFFAAKRFVALDGYSALSSIQAEELLSALTSYSTKDHDVIIVVREVDGGQKKPGRSSGKKSTGKKRPAGPLTFPGEKLETFPELTPVQASAWVMHVATARGATLLKPAAERLTALCAGDMWRMANELEKVLLYAGRQPVTVETIEQLVPSEYGSDIFALTDALGQQQTARALELLHRELVAGANAFGLVATISSHVRNLWQVKRAQERGVSPVVMATELGLHPFVVQKAAAQSKLFTTDALRDLHHRLLRVDHDLKTSPLDAETLLNVVLVRT